MLAYAIFIYTFLDTALLRYDFKNANRASENSILFYLRESIIAKKTN